MAKKILIAEDTRSTRNVLSFILANRGYDVIESADGDDALEKARTLNPDLLILDSDMPGKSGYDVFRALKWDPKFNAMPILFLVASTQETDLVTRSIPAAEFVVSKPFAAHDLVQRVLKVLGG